MGRIRVLAVLLLALLLCGCASEKKAAFSQSLNEVGQEEAEELLRQAEELSSMYFYDEALALLERIIMFFYIGSGELHNSDDVRQLTKLTKIISKCDMHRAMMSMGFPTDKGLKTGRPKLKSGCLCISGKQSPDSLRWRQCCAFRTSGPGEKQRVLHYQIQRRYCLWSGRCRCFVNPDDCGG